MSLDPPNARTWQERLDWFDHQFRPDRRAPLPRLGAQGEALLLECERAFASGGWITVVVLAQTVIDSEIAETLVDGVDDGLELNDMRFGRDFTWLRERRNAYVHNDGPGPAITARELELDAERLERDARRAVKLVARCLLAEIP
jgi:hypothetical protein